MATPFEHQCHQIERLLAIRSVHRDTAHRNSQGKGPLGSRQMNKSNTGSGSSFNSMSTHMMSGAHLGTLVQNFKSKSNRRQVASQTQTSGNYKTPYKYGVDGNYPFQQTPAEYVNASNPMNLLQQLQRQQQQQQQLYIQQQQQQQQQQVQQQQQNGNLLESFLYQQLSNQSQQSLHSPALTAASIGFDYNNLTSSTLNTPTEEKNPDIFGNGSINNNMVDPTSLLPLFNRTPSSTSNNDTPQTASQSRLPSLNFNTLLDHQENAQRPNSSMASLDSSLPSTHSTVASATDARNDSPNMVSDLLGNSPALTSVSNLNNTIGSNATAPPPVDPLESIWKKSKETEAADGLEKSYLESADLYKSKDSAVFGKTF